MSVCPTAGTLVEGGILGSIDTLPFVTGGVGWEGAELSCVPGVGFIHQFKSWVILRHSYLL